MLNKKNLILIFSLTILFLKCSAQSDLNTDQSKSTIQVRQEIAENRSKSKVELDKIYNESIIFLDSIGNIEADNYKLFLTESQDGWKIYSDGKCKIFEYQSRDAAQGGFAFYNLCITQLNNTRLIELINWLTEWKREFDDY